ncbi:nuclear transport factor 2 family protein [Evansella sp. AB-rgal1]|uniref:nuclear transport factor 2 family protein n=1 Tax=Evansella sp. AB-rgal1 TaxID=3242696 RepID=UPI00359D953E
METIAVTLAQKQLDAYNNQQLEEFLSCYSEDVKVMEFPSNKIIYTGKTKMKEVYSTLFESNPNNHAKLLARIADGNIVIDHEYVTGRANGKEVYAIAMYEVKDNEIIHVWFKK